MSVFISYNHDDEDVVEKIASYLVKENIHIWIDKWELNYGDSLIQKVQDAITESSVLLIMLSKKSVESTWCKKELTAGLQRELEEKRVVTIPVLLETCEIPLFLRDKFYADFRTDFDQSIVKLQNSLLRNTDVTLNKVQTDKYLIDWAIDNGLKANKFYLNIESVSFSKESEYSILCTLDVTGNEKFNNLYKKAIDRRSEHIIVNELINTLYELDKDNDFRLFVNNNIPQHKKFVLTDPKSNFEFVIKIYCRRLGINNGFDVLFDYGSIIRLVHDQRAGILKK